MSLQFTKNLSQEQDIGAPLSLSVPLSIFFFGAILLEVFPVMSDLNDSKPE